MELLRGQLQRRGNQRKVSAERLHGEYVGWDRILSFLWLEDWICRIQLRADAHHIEGGRMSWKVTRNVGAYQIWRQTRPLEPGEPMHSGVREVQGWFETSEEAQRAADQLNKEAAT